MEVFSKKKVAEYTDPMDNTGNMNCAVYARNACFDVAEKRGLKYFSEYDDDYTSHPYRWKEGDTLYRSSRAKLDEVFEAYIDFLETNENIYSVAFGQPGDFIGGIGSQLIRRRYLRKCMNSWICKTERRFYFSGTMNDDMLTYSIYGSRGKMFFTFPYIMIDQPETQSVKGGMTDLYLGAGTYQKTMYAVICCPSFVSVDMMGDRHYRIHHHTDKEHAYPKIISGRYKK